MSFSFKRFNQSMADRNKNKAAAIARRGAYLDRLEADLSRPHNGPSHQAEYQPAGNFFVKDCDGVWH